jgi:hypothetical protein
MTFICLIYLKLKSSNQNFREAFNEEEIEMIRSEFNELDGDKVKIYYYPITFSNCIIKTL